MDEVLRGSVPNLYSMSAAHGLGHSPRARLATALRSDAEGKADQITLSAAANRLRGDETAFAL